MHYRKRAFNGKGKSCLRFTALEKGHPLNCIRNVVSKGVRRGGSPRGFTLIEVILSLTILIFIYIAATTAQISSEFFLKNIRADFEKHLEFSNALDHIVKNVRRSSFAGGFPSSPNSQTLLLKINGLSGVVSYSQSGDNVLCSLEANPIARDAKITFSLAADLVSIQIVEDTSDPGESDKIPVVLITKAYARDK